MANPSLPADGLEVSTQTLDFGDGDGPADVQDVGVVAVDQEGASPARIAYGHGGGLLVSPATVTVGSAGAWPGLSAATYTAGKQIGDPLPAEITGVAVAAGEELVVAPLQVSIVDLEGELDATARLWVVRDLGGGIGDSGDGAAVDFTGAGGMARVVAQPYAVAQAPDGTPEVVTFGGGKVRVTFDVHFTVLDSATYFVLEAAGTWASTSSLFFNYGGVLLGYTPPT